MVIFDNKIGGYIVKLCILRSYEVITRVILAPNDVLTSFDIRAQIFRVNVEFSVYKHEQFFLSKMLIFDDKMGVYIVKMCF